MASRLVAWTAGTLRHGQQRELGKLAAATPDASSWRRTSIGF